jgi:hypothetical protein
LGASRSTTKKAGEAKQTLEPTEDKIEAFIDKAGDTV